MIKFIETLFGLVMFAPTIEKFIDVDCTDIWNIGTGKARSLWILLNYMLKKHNAQIEEIPA